MTASQKDFYVTPQSTKVNFFSLNGIISCAKTTPSEERANPSTVITLVHGTFAHGAPWTRSDSIMCCDWPSEPNRAVCFSIFNWSGANSHQGRLTATHELADHLRELLNEYPSAPHLVIAHSHGGNIALGALAREELKGKIKGLVCLNTPFLDFATRTLNPLRAILFLLNPVTLLVFASLPFYQFYMLPRYPGGFVWASLATAGLLMPALILMAFPGSLFWRYGSRLLDKIGAYQERRLSELCNHGDPNCPVLASTVKQDEAYYILGFLDLITDLTALGTKISYSLCLAGIVMLLVSGSGGFLTDFNWFPKITQAAMTLGDVAVATIGTGVALYFVSSLILGGVCAVLRCHKLGYGERISDSMLLRISVKPRPPSTLKADLQYFPVTVGGLKHSALYKSPEVVQSLAEWFSKVSKL